MNKIIQILKENGYKLELHTENLMSFWTNDDYLYSLEHNRNEFSITKHYKRNGQCCSPRLTRKSHTGIIRLMQDLIF